MSPDDHFRRSSDLGSINLDALIAIEEDAGKRTLLLILLNLNNNLISNTKTTELVSVDLARHLKAFDAHLIADAALMNKGKGAWKVLGSALFIAQVVLSYFLTTNLARIDSLEREIKALQISDARQESARLNRDYPPITGK